VGAGVVDLPGLLLFAARRMATGAVVPGQEHEHQHSRHGQADDPDDLLPARQLPDRPSPSRSWAEVTALPPMRVDVLARLRYIMYRNHAI
jgi:hypothetical protein